VAAKYAAGKKGNTVNQHQGRGGWGDQSFLHGNAGKMTTIETKTGNLSEESAKHHACPKSVKAWWNSRDKQRIPRCASYVCSENITLFFV